ncbi:MAG: AMP-binding protein [Acidimicrobiales bacterium]|nr:AMP-binding protein [Acidimicrobiales bacterium]
MARLVAVVAQGGTAFVDALRAAWDAGDAVAPIDPRLPAPARAAVLDALRPAVVLDPLDPGRTMTGAAAPDVDDGDALVIPTSGTTGPPKGVVLTHAALAAQAAAVHRHLGVGAGDRWLACLPLAHVGGLGVVVRALVDGVDLEVHDRFDAAAVADARDRGASLVSLVPTALDRVGAAGFRWVVLGGSADPVADRPANVVRTWGMTETGGGVVYGGRPLPGVEVTVVGDELHLRTPGVARGYRRSDGGVDRLPGRDGWYATGDAGSVAADGTVTVHGRLDDVIVTGGEKVWPDAVEAVLRRDPAVAEVAVAGRPDAEWGERVEAWVVPAPGAAAPGLDALRDRVRAELPAWCAPRAVQVVDALPRTPLGKVRRRDL